ncbi:hypothetical protein QKU48_gp1108 [Fadolivirus algeromassiliense]|jgi:hypothetical protein|uniref:Uncharacterized protein n=1 Tax=Fadolivirus FV1/VV64 TaxID=3070911 RepID=A0A7D3QWG8_9VIRU|nr:hypothetical protein QKU48_gp1108 [Fadolivirus algeromassiliense]QKF94566.1 hypothetical protein Fadolivirus_1_1108 [Fadolivirus FV1/VV64]
MNQIIKLQKALKDIQSISDIISVSLIDDNIDTWKINLKYPDNRCVILQFVFHLTEPLPPKATVVFPTDLEYVCFEELGCTKWGNNGDIVVLLLSLYNEYKNKAQQYSEDKKIRTKEKAQEKWEYVKSQHLDWDFKDVEKLMAEIPEEVIKELRIKAKEAIDSNCADTA